jgi:hypothetical protein
LDIQLGRCKGRDLLHTHRFGNLLYWALAIRSSVPYVPDCRSGDRTVHPPSLLPEHAIADNDQSKDRVCGPNARCLASRTIDSDHDDLVVLARMDRELEIVSASLSADTMYEYCSFSVSRHNASLPALSHCSGEQYVHGAKLPVHPGSLGCRRVHAQKREASL